MSNGVKINSMKFRRQLFKYIDADGAKSMLSEATLQFSNSSDFNDPFDCHPSLIDFSVGPNGRGGDYVMNNVRKRSEEEHNRLRNNTWICSLSKINDSLLMWSHYANSHKGVCVELNMAHACICIGKQRYGRIIHNMGVEVQYKDIIERPKYFKREKDFVNYQISTKSKDWEYEQEWRLYIVDPVQCYVDKKKNKVYPKLTGECFEAIYLGAKISEKDKKEIIRLARKLNNHIKIYQMSINADAFKLDVSDEIY